MFGSDSEAVNEMLDATGSIDYVAPVYDNDDSRQQNFLQYLLS